MPENLPNSVNDLTPEQVLRRVAELQFHPFDDYDKHDFLGCESPNPLIAKDRGWSWIIDGKTIGVYDHTTLDENEFTLTE